jgi:2-polyprenyl-3-methyl-5-hydroxy-6-metoxy-1,4-benzoquinol methylase
MLDLVKAVVPPAVRKPVRRAVDFAYGKATKSWTARAWVCDLRDAFDWVLGKSDPLTPPRKLVYGVGGELRHGEHIVGWLRDLAGLRPDEAVLDVGCGRGDLCAAAAARGASAASLNRIVAQPSGLITE